MRGRAIALVVMLGLVAGCADDGGRSSSASTTAAAPSTTAIEEASIAHDVVEELAADDLGGRDNHTPGSAAAQDLLVERLSQYTEPVPGAPDGYRWAFDQGTNLIGFIPGGELADEYVVIGAHYDHLGHDCRHLEPGDDICNGAGDNATGDAVVLELARRLAADPEPPRRSVVFVLWDAEEDGLQGSLTYVGHPAVPLEDTVTYVNIDTQGVNLLPSLSDTTVMVGAETGGPNLVDAATAAADAGPLDTLPFSLLFGQGRSDHAVFAANGVPTVFFTDATSGCYHSTQDEVGVVDFDKLDAQIGTIERLVRDLAATDAVPTYVGDAPPATFEDAQSMLTVVQRGEEDIPLLAEADQDVARQFVADLTDVVDAGADQFDDQAVQTLLGGSVHVVDALTRTDCDGYLS